MAEVDPIILQLRADVQKYRAELLTTTNRVDAALGRQEQAVISLERQWVRSAGALQRTVGGVRNLIAGAFAGVSFVALAREVLRYTDSFKQYEAQLRLATQQTGSFNQAQADVQRIAAETRTGLEETANLYATFQRNARELGISQEMAARATETVSKTFLISGASAAEAAGGLRQFLQGVQSGTLRGEELNSVLENAPRLARLLADSLGITIGQLREMGQEGKLAGDTLIAALTDRRFTAAIDEEFKQLPVTFDQAMTQVYNAATLTFGAFDRGGDFSNALASFISSGASGMSDLADAAEEAGIDTRASFEGLSDAFEPMLAAARAAFGQINLEAQSSAEYIRGALALLDDFRNAPADLVRGFGQRTGLDRSETGRRILGVPTNRSDMAGDFARGRARAENRLRTDQRDRRIQDQYGFRNPSDMRDFFAGTGRHAPPGSRPPASASGPKSNRKKPRGASAETLARREEAERQRQLREDQAFRDEKAQLDQDLLRAQRASVTAADTLAAFERQDIEAARVRQNDNYQASVGLKKLTQAQADELIAKNDAVAAEQQRAVNVREAQRKARDAVEVQTADLRNQQDVLQSQVPLLGANSKRRDAALRLLELQHQQERIELEAITVANGRTETEEKIAKARLAQLGVIQRNEREGVERDYESPFQAYARRLQNQGENIGDEVESLIVQRLDEVDDAISDAISNKLGVKDPLLKQLLNLFIQQNLIRPIAEAFSQSSSGVGSFISSIFGSIFGRSGGGYAPPNSVRRVNEHKGGGVELIRMGSQGGTVIPLGQANAAAARHPGTTVISAPQFNLKGAVLTPQLYADMERIAQASATQAAAASYGKAMRDAPSRVASNRRYGS